MPAESCLSSTAATMLSNARAALYSLSSYSQQEIDGLCSACCRAFKDHADQLSELTIEETGLGKLQDKYRKNRGAAAAAQFAVNGFKSIGLIGDDPRLHIKYVAHPKGVVFCTTPTTNPNMATLFSSVYSIKGANAIIVSPHPRAWKTTELTCRILQDAISAAGGPDNVIQCVEKPSKELVKELMDSADVVLGIASADMSRLGYMTGNTAYGIGHGNCQTIIDPAYDDLDGAIAGTIESACFDNALVCSCTRVLITPEVVADRVVESLQAQGAFYIDDPDLVARVREKLYPDGYGRLVKEAVGIDVQKLAKLLEIDVPDDTKLIVVRVNAAGIDEPLCGEQLTPLMAHIVSDDIDDAVSIAKQNLEAEGIGHISSIWTNDTELAEQVGMELPVSRFIVNCPSYWMANSGRNMGLTPTATPCSGSWVGSSLSENLGPQHFINISRIAWSLPASDVPSEDQVFSGGARYFSR